MPEIPSSATGGPSINKSNRSRSRDELSQQLFKTEDLLRPGWARPHVTRAGGRWDALTDLGSERQLESEISLMEAAIATPLEISSNSTMLDSGGIVTPVA